MVELKYVYKTTNVTFTYAKPQGYAINTPDATCHDDSWYSIGACRTNWDSVPDVGTVTGNKTTTVTNNLNLKKGDNVFAGLHRNSPGVQQQDIKIYIDGVLVASRNNTSASTSIGLNYVFTGGSLILGAPTYLETLDKLDQWSNAHYVPHSENALNY